MPFSCRGWGDEGSPEASAAVPNFGWGDKEPPAGWASASQANWGWGDKADGLLSPMTILPTVSGGWRYPDDGGVVVVLNDAWAQLGKTFRVKVKNTGTGVFYPPVKPGLRAAKIGSAYDVKPLLDGKRLRFVLPVLPVGNYDVYVYYDAPDFGQVKILTGAFSVVVRHHALEQWAMRKKLPAHWLAAGPRSFDQEPAVVSPSSEWPHKNVQALTRAVAEEVQLLSGFAVTRLTAVFAEGAGTATVESTLGFTVAGRFRVGVREYAYTGRTATTFTGCVAVATYDGGSLSVGTPVSPVVEAWVPEE